MDRRDASVLFGAAPSLYGDSSVSTAPTSVSTAPASVSLPLPAVDVLRHCRDSLAVLQAAEAGDCPAKENTRDLTRDLMAIHTSVKQAMHTALAALQPARGK